MLCDDVKRVIYFFLDGSLGKSKFRDVDDHLHRCPDCEARANVQRRLRLFIQKRLTPESAPVRLKRRLARSLRAFSTEWSR